MSSGSDNQADSELTLEEFGHCVANIAVVGTACCGKSTILKQLALQFTPGGMDTWMRGGNDERMLKGHIIHRFVARAMSFVAERAGGDSDGSGIDTTTPEWEAVLAHVESMGPLELESADFMRKCPPTPTHVLDALRKIAADSRVQRVVSEQMVESGKIGNVEIFINAGSRVLVENYRPSDDDILNMRERTQKLDFVIVPLPKSAGKGHIRFHDVPGQKEKFKQWCVNCLCICCWHGDIVGRYTTRNLLTPLGWIFVLVGSVPIGPCCASLRRSI